MCDVNASLLVIRDPDWGNDYTYDGRRINIITIDIGANWKDYKDFCSCLQANDEDAVEYERDLLEQAAKLDENDTVRHEIEAYFKRAREIT